MRKIFSIIIIAIMLSFLCSCDAAGLSSSLASPFANSSSSGRTASSTDLTSETQAPTKPTAEVDNKARGASFRTFLSDNYQKLSEAFFGGISGIGFIDLDMDGGIEMLIFDTGASAAMGLQFFDIVENKVECVSANMEAVGKVFGGKHLSDVVVNANKFDDFRLMEDKSTGEKFYIVQSGNGATDFSYSELIRFASDDGVLTISTLMYKYEDYDIDSGAVIGESFKISGSSANRSSYDAAYSKFFADVKDTGYEAKGIFLWELSEQDNGLSYDSMLTMADKALTLCDISENS